MTRFAHLTLRWPTHTAVLHPQVVQMVMQLSANFQSQSWHRCNAWLGGHGHVTKPWLHTG